MVKIIKKIYRESDGKSKDYSLLSEISELKCKNIFWYPSGWKDMQYIRKYNNDFLKENKLPEIGVFLYSDYRYYKDFICNIGIPHYDKEFNFKIVQLEGHYLLSSKERDDYNEIFLKNYNYRYDCSLGIEPDLWLTKTFIDGLNKTVFIVFTQMENNYLLYNIIKSYNLPVKYICTHCDGKDEGGNHTSFLEKPYSINFQKYIKEYNVNWIEGKRF